jgi:hypothetical protein
MALLRVVSWFPPLKILMLPDISVVSVALSRSSSKCYGEHWVYHIDNNNNKKKRSIVSSAFIASFFSYIVPFHE